MVAAMIKAIETEWNGYRFRSRLEARWAVFFQAVGIEWEYEPEGFDLGPDLGWYLPDFIMLHNPGRGPYVEIKPTEPTPSEYKKMQAVCAGARDGCGAYGAMIWGAPGKHQWVSIDKEGDFSGEEQNNSLSDFLGCHTLGKGLEAVGVIASRSARFEHGQKPVVF